MNPAPLLPHAGRSTATKLREMPSQRHVWLRPEVSSTPLSSTSRMWLWLGILVGAVVVSGAVHKV